MSMSIVSKFGEVIDWRKDLPWGETDGPLKTVEKCVAIQDALHG